MPNSAVVLVGRILLSIIFILAGFGKFADIGGTAAYFASYNLPLPSITAVVAGLIELVGGLMILVGFQTRIAAYILALFCVATALIGHLGWSVAATGFNNMIHFQKNLAMAGGFLVLAAFGAGAYSIDARRG